MILLATLMSAGLMAFAGEHEGNGGDFVRQAYLNNGRDVVNYLRVMDAGKAVRDKNQLDTDRLESTLSIQRIEVVEEPLKDNGGSVVDAITENGHTRLSKTAWEPRFQQNQEVHSMVFHEMLRSAGYHDDNYVISRGVDPFPADSFELPKAPETLPNGDVKVVVDIQDGTRISHAGNALVTFSKALQFTAWNTETGLAISRFGQRNKRLCDPGDVMRSPSFGVTPDGRQVYAYYADHSFEVWNLSNGHSVYRKVLPLDLKTSPLCDVEYSNDQAHVVYRETLDPQPGHFSERLCVLDLRSTDSSPVCTPPVTESPNGRWTLMEKHFSADGQTVLYLTGRDCWIRALSLDGKVRKLFNLPQDPNEDVALRRCAETFLVSPSGVAVAGHRSDFVAVNDRTGDVLDRLHAPYVTASFAEFHPWSFDGSALLFDNWLDRLGSLIWRPTQGSWTIKSGTAIGHAMNANATRLLAVDLHQHGGESTYSLELWDVPRGKRLTQWMMGSADEGHNLDVLGFTPTGKVVQFSNYAGELFLRAAQ